MISRKQRQAIEQLDREALLVIALAALEVAYHDEGSAHRLRRLIDEYLQRAAA